MTNQIRIPVKLGKREPRFDDRTLLLHKYTEKLAPPPESTSWLKSKTINFPMYANDQVGDCTCAGGGHLINQWTGIAGDAEAMLSDKEILEAYSAITGYTPGKDSTDTGAAELDVLNYWKNTGIAGHKISAFTAIEANNLVGLKQSIALTGGAYLGIQLPEFAESATQWSLPFGWKHKKIAGGHCIVAVDYDPHWIYIVSWGEVIKMSYQFYNAYCDEAYSVFSPDWIEKDGKAPSGFDTDQLLADVQAI